VVFLPPVPAIIAPPAPPELGAPAPRIGPVDELLDEWLLAAAPLRAVDPL